MSDDRKELGELVRAVEVGGGVYCGKTDDGSRYFATRDASINEDPDAKVFFGATLPDALRAFLADIQA